MSAEDILEKLGPVFDRVNRQLQANLSTEIPFIAQVCHYTLLGGGKRLRPALFILASQVCDYQGDKEYYYSTTFEYAHAASLLHDDVVDESDVRRGQAATHVVYGNQAAVLVGDFLLAKATSQAFETGNPKFVKVLSEVASLMSEGEILQLLHILDAEMTEEEYERVIYRKTGALIQGACRLGAVLADAPAEFETALSEYGRDLGLAFQMIDDTLDYIGTEAEFGKPTGQDLDEGKITLPLIYTLAQADRQDRRVLLDLILQEERRFEDFNRIKRFIDKYHGLDYATAKAERLIKKAKESLSVFSDSPPKNHLLDLADFIVSRRM